MNTATYSVILEIEAHANGNHKDVQRHIKTLQDLRESQIYGHNVVAVITTNLDQPANVKHFGYDYRCKAVCKHEPTPYGILRYFGTTLVITQPAEFGSDLFGTYQVNSIARVTICGVEMPYKGARNNLELTK